LSNLSLSPRRGAAPIAGGLSTTANSAAQQPVEGKNSMSKDADILKDADGQHGFGTPKTA